MRLALCLEQTLGHRAHSSNLVSALGGSGADIDFVNVEYGADSRIPWAFRGSWQAASLLRRAPAADVRFYHTQSMSLFAPAVNRGRPFVVSVDATPRQIDGMGRWYDHKRSSGVLERAKDAWYRGVFARAAAVVAWSSWAADSLVTDYRVSREKIAIVHPGAPRGMFQIERGVPNDGLPNILFVGGDLERKGGDMLLEVFKRLEGKARLLLVTSEAVPRQHNVEVITATPGSPELIDAYRRASIFCLPTRGDCTPVVLGEAMAAGLPIVTTVLGSNSETVTDGVDGYLIEPNDATRLEAVLTELLHDPARRRALGIAARSKALENFDAEKNAFRILTLLRSVAK